jgi:hypothetical protein
MSTLRLVVAPLACLPLIACSSDSAPTGPRVAIGTSPLTLIGVSNACYRLTVQNGAAQTVWQKANVCADDYGDGRGAISYIGPCDAQLVDGDPQENTVRLELEDLYDSSTDSPGGPIDRDTYQNPCGHLDNGNNDGAGPCELAFECRENQDVAVEFNVTIMRSANQGFFDIAVNFEDIFCSAKLDCSYPDGNPIELLFDPSTNERGQTAVVALACTAGPDSASGTVLHMQPIGVKCGDVELELDPTAGPGNVWTASNPDPDPEDAIWQYAVYRDNELLPCGEGSCQKVYWNVAIGFDPSADCKVKLTATASGPDTMTGNYTPDNATYPVITYSVPLSTTTTTDNGAVTKLCGQNPLNGEGSGVSTGYTPVGTPAFFCYTFDGQVTTAAEDCHPAAQCDPNYLKSASAQPTTLYNTIITSLGDATCSELAPEQQADLVTYSSSVIQQLKILLEYIRKNCDLESTAIAAQVTDFTAMIVDLETILGDCPIAD